MKAIKFLAVMFMCVFVYSCHDKPVVYQDRIAQDLNFRLGKWYSITDSTVLHTSSNPYLDTIWFMSDSIAGWTGFVPYDPYKYSIRRTYFDGSYKIIYEVPDPNDSTQILKVSHECGMNTHQDTFGIYWDDGNYGVMLQQYVKKK